MRVELLETQAEQAKIIPEFGCQCISYRVGSLELIAGPSDFERLRAEPFSWGIPLLFPWPGRMGGGRFEWRGRSHSLPVNEALRGHALHGLVYDRRFRVVKRGPFYLQTELKSSESGLTSIWPYEFTLKVDYEVGNGLRIRVSAENTGPSSMPFGFGLHPYFRLPLSDRGSRAESRIQLPADRQWPLDENLLPVAGPVPVSGKFDLRDGPKLGTESYDHAFCSMAPGERGEFKASLLAPEISLAVDLEASADFHHWVLYAPLGRDIASIEPYTCPPDAFNLAAKGLGGDVLELLPGETWQGSIAINISAL